MCVKKVSYEVFFHFVRKLLTRNYVFIILEYGPHLILIAMSLTISCFFVSYDASGICRNDSHSCVVLFTHAKNCSGVTVDVRVLCDSMVREH